MTTFAQIKDGKVIATFSCDQDPDYWPGVIEVEETDSRLVEYLDSIDLKKPGGE